ncbi:MAG TPA: aminoglycoside phosphotransferase family protein [Dehalococcoidia bacterium]|nr:aminoglycoside phosphotransferase family protein [Dehalococcoidia bacterium]
MTVEQPGDHLLMRARSALEIAFADEAVRLLQASSLDKGRHDLLLLEVVRAGRPAKLVLRTYRHRITWWSDQDPDKAAREEAALRQVGRFGLPAPAVHAAGPDWTLVDWIHGEPLGDHDAVTDGDVPAAQHLAGVLARLHRLPLPDGPFPRPSPGEVINTIHRWSAGLGNDRLTQAIRRVVPPPAGKPAFIHGDRNRTNVLVSADHQIAGLIDWEDAAIADPRFDVGRAAASLARLDPALAASFLAAYEAEWGAPVVDLAQWLALLAVQRWTMIELLRTRRPRADQIAMPAIPDDIERLLREAGW